MSNLFSHLMKYIFILVLLISIIFVPILYSSSISNSAIEYSDVYSQYGFLWPIPGYTNISSPFGRRNSPTKGASSYHSGIDIPAPEGTPIYAIEDGFISFASWGARWWIYYCFGTY